LIRMIFVTAVLTLFVSGLWGAGITNGSFATGDTTGWTWGGACSPFTPDFPCYAYVVNSGLPGGDIYALIVGTYPTQSTMDQMVTLPAGNWTVSFDLELTTATPPGPNYVNVLWDGSTILALSNMPAAPWTHETSATFTSTGAPTDLMFQFLEDTTGNFWIDNIAAAAVPEPATLVLFGLGLTILGALHRRKQVNRAPAPGSEHVPGLNLAKAGISAKQSG